MAVGVVEAVHEDAVGFEGTGEVVAVSTVVGTIVNRTAYSRPQRYRGKTAIAVRLSREPHLRSMHP